MRQAALRRSRVRLRPRRDASAHAEVVARVRAEVFRLDRVCAVCGGRPGVTDEMHEVVSRARTRGLPPEERFSRAVCVRLHRPCHADVTEHRVELALCDPALGVDGGVVVWRRGDAEGLVYRRGAQPSHVSAGRGAARRGVWTPAG